MLGGRIFAVGGDDGVTHLNSAECYDAQLNEWGEVVCLCICNKIM